jgi:hypothetical protein
MSRVVIHRRISPNTHSHTLMHPQKLLTLILHRDGAAEAALIEGVDVIPVANLTEVVNHLHSTDMIAPGANRAIAVAKRIRKLFKVAGLTYRSPHKFRHGHAVYSLQHAKTMADYKAVSMNLMHQDIRVTDSIYAPLVSDEVQQRIAGLTGTTVLPLALAGEMASFISTLSKGQLSKALMAIAQQLTQA